MAAEELVPLHGVRPPGRETLVLSPGTDAWTHAGQRAGGVRGRPSSALEGAEETRAMRVGTEGRDKATCVPIPRRGTSEREALMTTLKPPPERQ